MERLRHLGIVVLSAFAAIVCTSCSLLAVGTARTDGPYRAKAMKAVAAGEGATAAASLVCDASVRGRATQAYLSVAVREAEASASGAASALSKVQPPSDRAAAIGDDALDVVQGAADALRHLRDAVRRGEMPERAGELCPPVRDAHDALEQWEDAHQ